MYLFVLSCLYSCVTSSESVQTALFYQVARLRCVFWVMIVTFLMLVTFVMITTSWCASCAGLHVDKRRNPNMTVHTMVSETTSFSYAQTWGLAP